MTLGHFGPGSFLEKGGFGPGSFLEKGGFVPRVFMEKGGFGPRVFTVFAEGFWLGLLGAGQRPLCSRVRWGF